MIENCLALDMRAPRRRRRRVHTMPLASDALCCFVRHVLFARIFNSSIESTYAIGVSRWLVCAFVLFVPLLARANVAAQQNQSNLKQTIAPLIISVDNKASIFASYIQIGSNAICNMFTRWAKMYMCILRFPTFHALPSLQPLPSSSAVSGDTRFHHIKTRTMRSVCVRIHHTYVQKFRSIYFYAWNACHSLPSVRWFVHSFAPTFDDYNLQAAHSVTRSTIHPPTEIDIDEDARTKLLIHILLLIHI